MGRKALFRLPLRLSCGPLWDFSDSLIREILRSSHVRRSRKFASRSSYIAYKDSPLG